MLVEQTFFGFHPAHNVGMNVSHRPSTGVLDGHSWIQENSSMTQCVPLGNLRSVTWPPYYVRTNEKMWVLHLMQGTWVMMMCCLFPIHVQKLFVMVEVVKLGVCDLVPG